MRKIIILLVFSLCFSICPRASADKEEELCEIIIRTAEPGSINLHTLTSLSPDTEIVYTFDSVMNGYVIKAPESALSEIKNIEGVLDACISETVYMPVINESSASSMVGSPDAEELGFDGEGTVVAIIDSEMDFNHDVFTLTNPEKAKIKKSDVAQILANNELNLPVISANRVYRNPKVPFAYDYCIKNPDVWDDQNIHGTHVAGIAAGNGDKFKGIAPEAQIIFMKVFRTIAGTSLGTTADVFAAVEDAVEFGVSAINLSLSVDYAFSDSSTYSIFRTIIDNARSRGIVISSSSGNLGRGYQNNPIKTDYVDYGISGIPSGFTDTLSVGSVNNRVYTAYSIICEDKTIPIDLADNSFTKKFNDKYYSYTDAGYGKSAEDFSDASGKILLIDLSYTKGNNALADKVKLAKASGATGVIFISKNNSYYAIGNTELPSCLVSKEHGEFLKKAKEKTVKANNFLSEVEFSDISVSDFSAYNYTSDLTLSVDITAPGGMIYSSVPDNLYKSMSGTSMSAPQLTGAAAIMDSYITKTFPGISGKEKTALSENLLMSAAEPAKNKKGVYESPAVQGAGLLNLKGSLTASSVLYGDNSKTKICLKDKIKDNFSLSFTKESLKESDGYDTLAVYTITDGSYEKDGEYYIGDTVSLSNTFSYTSEKLSDRKTKYTLDITLDSEETKAQSKIFKNGFFLGGYVFLTASDNSEVPLSIPFFGFYGDFSKSPAIDSKSEVFNTSYPYSYLTINGKKEYRPLGYNMFDGSFHEDKMVISPDGDGFNDTMYILPLFLRDLNTLYIMLMESEYVSLSQITKGPVAKFSGSSYYNLPVINRYTDDIIEDGEYFIRTVGALKYNNKLQTVDYPVTFDTEKPKVHSVKKDAGGYTLTVSDNHHIQAVVMEGFDSSGVLKTETYIPKNDTKGEEITVSFNTENLTSITFSVYDYGYNKKIIKEADGSAPINGSYQLYFVNDKEITADIYPASYKENILSDICILRKEKVFADKILPLDSEGDSVKVFFWKEGSMIPEKDICAFIIY